ncbi:hypothetical protein GOP97_14870 [Vibrio cholerae]|uniref:hypothetical protein n=1 Tax=Vibrio cholerae TaxID=666 RepID=UPI002DBF0601|nr:hypothetical protein [Vibrio cholerae]MEB5557049.1 hypothetical protein [Vibrio cholerae]
MKIEVFRENAWVQHTPNVGELCRITYPTGHVIEATYQGESVESDVQELINIVITNVQGASNSSSDFTKITAKEGSTLIVSGTLAIKDKTFITPIQKENISTGEVSTIYKEIEVIDGAFSVELTLPVGKYRITQELMNAELPQAAFSLDTIEIYITI